MTQEEHMTSTPTKVDYDIMLPLVCEEHYEYSALLCCPFPGCPNGTSSEEIEASYNCIAPGSLDTSLSHAAGLSDIAVCHA